MPQHNNGNGNPPSLASLAPTEATPAEKPKRKYTRRTLDGPYKIEKGIPIPEPKGPKYPWADMLVGDSFYVPNAPEGLSGMCSNKSKKGPHTFTARKVKGGMRVWRTK